MWRCFLCWDSWHVVFLCVSEFAVLDVQRQLVLSSIFLMVVTPGSLSTCGSAHSVARTLRQRQKPNRPIPVLRKPRDETRREEGRPIPITPPAGQRSVMRPPAVSIENWAAGTAIGSGPEWLVQESATERPQHEFGRYGVSSIRRFLARKSGR